MNQGLHGTYVSPYTGAEYKTLIIDGIYYKVPDDLYAAFLAMSEEDQQNIIDAHRNRHTRHTKRG